MSINELLFTEKLAKDIPLKKSSQSPDVIKFLDEEMNKTKQRILELNDAYQEMILGYEQVLKGLKMAYKDDIDLHDANLEGTPRRMARALIELCSGLGVKDKEIFSRYFPSESYDEMVMLKDIDYTSLCAHHFMPFTGKAHIGYIPESGKGKNEARVVGLSKLARIVESYARRPQLQEKMCVEIMKAIKTQLKPEGIMVVIEGKHGCLSCRGVKKTQSSMTTSALDGKFKESEKMRSEFLSLLQLRPLSN